MENFSKNIMSKLDGGSNPSSNTNTNANANMGATNTNTMGGSSTTAMGGQNKTAAGGEDYLDKGLDSVERKFGGGKVNPETSRGMNEQITDGARGMFEKATGKHVPEKYSN